MGKLGLIQVACASNTNGKLDGHFGSCEQFLIYQVSAGDVSLVDVRKVDDSTSRDKTMHRASLINDCDIVYLCDIGGPAAAKVIKTGIFPVKQAAEIDAIELMRKLSDRLASKPAPWLAKIMQSRSQNCLVT